MESNVRVHTFSGPVSEGRAYFQVTDFGRSLYIWVGTSEGRMGDLALSAPTRYDTAKGLPTTTKIMGSGDHTDTEALAGKLSKRLGKPVLLSLNLGLSSSSPHWGDVEKVLFDQVKSHPEHFSIQGQLSALKLGE